MENRVKCPHCMGEGEILTAVHATTGERIFMCDKCNDIWENIDLIPEKSLSYDTYMLKMNRKREEFETWEYLIK